MHGPMNVKLKVIRTYGKEKTFRLLQHMQLCICFGGKLLHSAGGYRLAFFLTWLVKSLSHSARKLLDIPVKPSDRFEKND